MSFDEFEEKFLGWCARQYRLRLILALITVLTIGFFILLAFVIRWLEQG